MHAPGAVLATDHWTDQHSLHTLSYQPDICEVGDGCVAWHDIALLIDGGLWG